MIEHPQVSLGELLKLEQRPIKVELDKQYAEIGIYSYGKGIFHKLPRTGFEVGDKDLFLIKEGDFILQITFAWEGAVGLASEAEDGMFGSVRFPTFRVDESRCYPPYLVNYFRTNEGRQQLVAISPGSAGRNRVLSMKRIPEVVVPLPPLDEQRRIVAKIEGLAAKVEEARGLRREAVEGSEALRDAEFRVILATGERNPNWNYKLLSTVAIINPSRRGQTDFPESYPVSFVPMAAVDDKTGTIAKPETRSYAEVSKGYTWFIDGDVIFARITPCMENGKAALAEKLSNGVGFGSTEFHVLRPGEEVLGRWVHALVRHKGFRDDAASHFKGTAGQQRVPQRFLEQKVIPIPPLDEQEKIVDHLDNLQVKVDSLKHLQAETAAELDALLPSALDKAFKGEL